MKTAVVIPTYNRPDMVARVLKSLESTEIPTEVEIYVIENGPKRGVEEICRELSIGGKVHYLYSSVASKSAAANCGIRHAEADFIIFFDDDIRIEPVTIRTYIDAAKRYGPGYFFGGPFLADAELPCPRHLLPHLPYSARGHSFAETERVLSAAEFRFFVGFNWAAFRTDLLQVGLYPEGVGVTSSEYCTLAEETILQQALIAHSVCPVNLPAAVVHHWVGKLCYELDWVRHRRLRHGITDSVISREKHSRLIAGIPLWVLRQLITACAKLFLGCICRKSLEYRTEQQMRISYLRGWIHAALHRREYDPAS